MSFRRKKKVKIMQKKHKCVLYFIRVKICYDQIKIMILLQISMHILSGHFSEEQTI